MGGMFHKPNDSEGMPGSHRISDSDFMSLLVHTVTSKSTQLEIFDMLVGNEPQTGKSYHELFRRGVSGIVERRIPILKPKELTGIFELYSMSPENPLFLDSLPSRLPDDFESINGCPINLNHSQHLVANTLLRLEDYQPEGSILDATVGSLMTYNIAKVLIQYAVQDIV